MHRIQRNRPRIPPYVPLPQCCVPIPTNTLWTTTYRERRRKKMEEGGWDVNYCHRGGTIQIDGKNYCGQHAGQVALAILLNEPVDFNQPGDEWRRD